ncbi:CatB-related O-acetyltransferase [Sinorhizobium meliloti]|uniref:CatB-related O-acetyltransferase n=1 Tax=Rhizobium meliloti TaxID=382 RepID=UPI0013E32EA5|nr:CatB-related O-acetyltransferase [Sinorhizobium meliloti]
MTNLVPFGNSLSRAHLLELGFEIDFAPTSLMRVGSVYEGPCSIKTSIREITSFGAFSYINGRGRFSNVRIGRYCSIAEAVSVGYPEHPIDWMSTSSLQYMRPNWSKVSGDWKRVQHTTVRETVIGNDVWIGAGVFLRTGITIGTGAVIGAHAVVTKDVEPYSVVVGNPGRVIRKRLPDRIIPDLVASAWWEFSPAQMSGCPFNDPEKAAAFVADLRTSGIQPYLPKKLVISADGACLR